MNLIEKLNLAFKKEIEHKFFFFQKIIPPISNHECSSALSCLLLQVKKNFTMMILKDMTQYVALQAGTPLAFMIVIMNMK